MSQPRKSFEADLVDQAGLKCFYYRNLQILKNYCFTMQTGAMLAHRARQFAWDVFPYFSLLPYFFGLDSGGTSPLFR
jgi:hypothetical protein